MGRGSAQGMGSAALEARTTAVATTTTATARTAEGREERPAAGEREKGYQQNGFDCLGNHDCTIVYGKKRRRVDNG